jgi:hypothetical protein
MKSAHYLKFNNLVTEILKIACKELKVATVEELMGRLKSGYTTRESFCMISD